MERSRRTALVKEIVETLIGALWFPPEPLAATVAQAPVSHDNHPDLMIADDEYFDYQRH